MNEIVNELTKLLISLLVDILLRNDLAGSVSPSLSEESSAATSVLLLSAATLSTLPPAAIFWCQLRSFVAWRRCVTPPVDGGAIANQPLLTPLNCHSAATAEKTVYEGRLASFPARQSSTAKLNDSFATWNPFIGVPFQIVIREAIGTP